MMIFCDFRVKVPEWLFYFYLFYFYVFTGVSLDHKPINARVTLSIFRCCKISVRFEHNKLIPPKPCKTL